MKYIKEITPEATFSVRHLVLRAGKPIESCRFDGDELITTKHFGLYIEANLIGVITVLENSSSLFKDQKQFQIRGMAVLESHQKKGFGEDLMYHTETYINTQKGTLIWFNARIIAVGFYEKLGYEKIGEAFEISNVGMHFVMIKKIK